MKNNDTLLYVGIGLAAFLFLRPKAKPSTAFMPVNHSGTSMYPVTTNTNPISSILNSVTSIVKQFTGSGSAPVASPTLNDDYTDSTTDIFGNVTPLPSYNSSNNFGLNLPANPFSTGAVGDNIFGFLDDGYMN